MAVDEKSSGAGAEQHENIGLDNKDTSLTHIAEADAAAHGQLTTGYEGLGVWETIKTFKVASGVCFLAAFTAAMDGYQIS